MWECIFLLKPKKNPSYRYWQLSGLQCQHYQRTEAHFRLMRQEQVSDGCLFKDVKIRNVLNIRNTVLAKSVTSLGIKTLNKS